MKKILLLLPLLLVFAGLTAFSRLNNSVDPRVEQLFKSEFAGAANVVWAKTGDFLKASFTWADHQAVAYFNSDAELVGCIRGLFFSQLPLTVIRSVERNFKNAVILETMEITNDEGVSYKLVMEYKDKKHEIRLNSFGDILTNKKIKK
jgi:hypothetical protein